MENSESGKAVVKERKRGRAVLTCTVVVLILAFWFMPFFVALFVKNGAVADFDTDGGRTLVFTSGSVLQTISSSGVHEWDVRTGRLLTVKPLPAGTGPAVSANGRFVVAADVLPDLQYKSLAVRRVSDGSLLSFLKPLSYLPPNGPEWITAPTTILSPDGRFAVLSGKVVAPYDPFARFTMPNFAGQKTDIDLLCGWETKTGLLIWNNSERRLSAETPGGVPIAISSDSRYLAEGLRRQAKVGEIGITVRLTNSGQGFFSLRSRIYRVPSEPDTVLGWSSLAFSPGNQQLAAVGAAWPHERRDSHDGAIYLWDISTQSTVWTNEARGIVSKTVIFSPDRRRLASTRVRTRRGGVIDLWDAATGKLIRTYERNSWADKVAHERMSSLYSLRRSLFTARSYASAPRDISDNFDKIAFSNDSQLIAGADPAGRVTVWPVE